MTFEVDIWLWNGNDYDIATKGDMSGVEAKRLFDSVRLTQGVDQVSLSIADDDLDLHEKLCDKHLTTDGEDTIWYV